MFTYNAAKAILDYLRPLYTNEYSINDTQKFPSNLSSITPLQDDEEDVSYDSVIMYKYSDRRNNQLYH